jgi:hypothetical protein
MGYMPTTRERRGGEREWEMGGGDVSERVTESESKRERWKR